MTLTELRYKTGLPDIEINSIDNTIKLITLIKNSKSIKYSDLIWSITEIRYEVITLSLNIKNIYVISLEMTFKDGVIYSVIQIVDREKHIDKDITPRTYESVDKMVEIIEDYCKKLEER